MSRLLFQPLRLALLAASLLTLPAQAAEVAGIHFDERTELAGSELVLNGAGLRTRFMLKIYAAGLYLPRRVNDLEAISAIVGPRRMQIVTLRDLSAEQFADALSEGLKRNHDAAEWARLQARSNDLRNAILSLEAAPAGSQIRLEWLPGHGTRLSVGNAVRGPDIPGEDFYLALLRIWLGDKPADQELKKALLGKG